MCAGREGQNPSAQQSGEAAWKAKITRDLGQACLAMRPSQICGDEVQGHRPCAPTRRAATPLALDFAPSAPEDKHAA
jgi:hypothetical protein